MTPGWLLVIFLGVSTAIIKAAGPVALGGRALPPRVLSVLRLLAPALFAALAATQVFASGQDLTLDARVGGLSAAALAVALRAPAPAVLLVAAAVTATLRLLVR